MHLGVWDEAVLQLKHLKKSLGITTIYGSEEQKHLCQKSPVLIAGDAGKPGLRTCREHLETAGNNKQHFIIVFYYLLSW